MTSSRALAALVACVLLAAASAACSDDSGLSDEEFAEAAQTAANASVLVLEDMPAGWRAEPDEIEDPADSDSGLTDDCVAFEQNEDGWPGRAAYSESLALLGPTHEINNSASVFRDADDAESMLTSYFDLFEECRQQLIDVTLADPAFADGDTYNLTQIEGIDFGEFSGGLRVELTNNGEPVVVDFIHVQQGRIITTLIYGGRAANDADRDTHVARQVEKARLADAELPE